MTTTDAAGSDMGVGLTMLFGVLAVLGSIAMAATGFVATASLRGGLDVAESVTHSMEVNAAVGFALAMTFALLAVVVVHWYES